MANNKVQLSNGTVLIDLTDTTAVASDVAVGKYFYTANGIRTEGTATGGGGSITIEDVPNATGTTLQITTDGSGGGGGVSATEHDIYFEFSDSTNTTIPVYYDDALISTMITAYTPATYSGKTVTLAQLDGVTWYEPADIPLNTQLIDYTSVTTGYIINGNTGEVESNENGACSDYTTIDPTMTFSYIGYRWWDAAFYDSTKTYISGFTQGDYADSIDATDCAHGTLTPARIPSNAAYIRLTSYAWVSSQYMSLIRTA